MKTPVGQEPASKKSKRKGVKFKGRRLSATTKDQNAVTAVATLFMYERGQGRVPSPTKMRFSNGSTLVVKEGNFDEFYVKWSAFRQSFYSE